MDEQRFVKRKCQLVVLFSMQFIYSANAFITCMLVFDQFDYVSSYLPNLQITKFSFNLDFQESSLQFCISNSKFCPPKCTISKMFANFVATY